MLERFEELKDEIVQLGNTEFITAITDNLPSNPAMNNEMMAVLDVYRKLLEPFKVITVAAQGSTYPTLGLVARFLMPIVTEKDGNMLAPSEEDGRLQT